MTFNILSGLNFSAENHKPAEIIIKIIFDDNNPHFRRFCARGPDTENVYADFVF